MILTGFEFIWLAILRLLHVVFYVIVSASVFSVHKNDKYYLLVALQIVIPLSYHKRNISIFLLFHVLIFTVIMHFMQLLGGCKTTVTTENNEDRTVLH